MSVCAASVWAQLSHEQGTRGARAPRMQSNRCRLVGAWLQTARRQVRYINSKKKRRLENTLWRYVPPVRLSPLP